MEPSALSFSLAGISYLGTSYMMMDCQEFVEKTLRKVGISKNLPGSNAWYREMTWVGSPEECKQRFGCIPKGAFLFILEQDGKEPAKYRGDGIGNASHIGIYTGLSGQKMVEIAVNTGNRSAASCDFGDGAIHSSMSRGCVATSRFAGKAIPGGWNRIGIWDDLDWGEEINRELSAMVDFSDEELSPATPVANGSAGEHGSSSADVSVQEDVDAVASATVWAEKGLPVKMRQSRDRKSRLFGLYDEYPVGTAVEVLSSGAEWSKIRIGGRTGWMMSQFLKPDDISVKAGPTDTSSPCCNDDYCEIIFPEPGAVRSEVASPAPNIATLRTKMQELMEAIDEWMKEDDHQ